MQDRNLLSFILFTAAFMLLWFFIAPKLGLVPEPPKPKPDAALNIEQPAEENQEVNDEGKAAETPDDNQVEVKLPLQKDVLANNPPRKLSLGTLEEGTGYYLQVDLSTTGGVVEAVWLNDKRYKDTTDTTQPLQLLGNNITAHRSFAMSMKSIDEQLQKHQTNLQEVEWKVAKETKDGEILKEVVFQYTAPDGALTLEKRFVLNSVKTEEPAQVDSLDTRDIRSEGYFLDVSFNVLNHSDKPHKVKYTAFGPVGIDLENQVSTTKYRDIKFRWEEAAGEFDESYKTASNVMDEHKEEAGQEKWSQVFSFIGVDVQYFAALMVPQDERNFTERFQHPWVEYSQAVLISENKNDERLSDISFQLVSKEKLLPAGEKLKHSYRVFLGPKKSELLAPIQAEYVMEVWWGIAWLSKPMMSLLHFMNVSVGFPYWLAIICLTIVVRGSMHPITRKQAASAKRMKELQPKIAELKKKHGKDREKMAQAQMQLFRENNYNPFAGCLPILLQMPIFIALYQGLRSTIDLRLAKFLWIDNLAAPDNLFNMSFNLPFLGDEFNLLPILTIGLFILQQKMFMPTPDPNDEMAMQTQKMMKFMMIFMGFMFYHVPAGLCVYFITSSLWGIGERKLLDFQKTPEPVPEAKTTIVVPSGKTNSSGSTYKNEEAPTKPAGPIAAWWNKVKEAAEAQQQLQSEQAKKKNTNSSGKKKKKR